jgi:hypothetical protein
VKCILKPNQYSKHQSNLLSIVLDLLVPLHRESFQKSTRLVIAGEDLFGPMYAAEPGGSNLMEMHELMEKNGVLHVPRPDLKFKHGLSKNWVLPLFEEEMRIAGLEERHSA